MRIVSGTLGGRRLIVPKGRDIRPTSDKIRGAIFNALRSRGVVEGAHVLDGFCGTGALGFEALSQGARACTFNDSARSLLDLAKENAKALGVDGQSKFMLKELAKYGQCFEDEQKFTLVFLDPPYNKNLILPAMETLDTKNWLVSGAFIVVEAEKNFTGGFPVAYRLLDEKSYGETKVFYLIYDK